MVADASVPQGYLYEYGSPNATTCQPYERVCGAFAEDKDAVNVMEFDWAGHASSKGAVYNKYQALVEKSMEGDTLVTQNMKWCTDAANNTEMLSYLKYVSDKVDFSPSKLLDTLVEDISNVFIGRVTASGMNSIATKILYLFGPSVIGNPLGNSADYGILSDDGIKPPLLALVSPSDLENIGKKTFTETPGARAKLGKIMDTFIDLFKAGKFFDDKKNATLKAIQDLEFKLAKCTEIGVTETDLYENEVPMNKKHFPVDYDKFLTAAVQYGNKAVTKDICPTGDAKDCFAGLTSFNVGYFKCLKKEIFATSKPDDLKKFYLWRTLFSMRNKIGSDEVFKAWKPLAPEADTTYDTRADFCASSALGAFSYHYIVNIMKDQYEAQVKQLNSTFVLVQSGLLEVINSWSLPDDEEKEFSERVQRLFFKGIGVPGKEFKLSLIDQFKPNGSYFGRLYNITARQEDYSLTLQEVGKPNDDGWSPAVSFPPEYLIVAHAYKYDPLITMHQIATMMAAQSISLAALQYSLNFSSVTPTSSPVNLYNCTFDQFKSITDLDIKKDSLTTFWMSSHWSNLGSENIAMRATWAAYLKLSKSPCKSTFLETYAYANCGYQTHYLNGIADLNPQVVNYAIASFLSDFGAMSNCSAFPDYFGRCLPFEEYY